jgi:ornithine cyclodeaminase/alanine dehydrogenase-like protein (mu-crystallin family)
MQSVSVSGAAVYLLDESDNRNLWIIGSGVMASIFPWTMIVMMPDIKKLYIVIRDEFHHLNIYM